MKTLETTLKIRVDTEEEAKVVIENYKKEANTSGYRIKKAAYEYKTKKAKKEIVDEGYLVTITQTYNEFWD